MGKDIRNHLIIILGFLLIGLLYSFLIAYYNMPPLKLGGYWKGWLFGTTVETFVSGFIPLVAAGILVAASLLEEGLPQTHTTSEGIQNLRKLFLVSLGIACMYGALQEGFLPWGIQVKQNALRRAEITHQLKVKASSAEKEKKYTHARFYLESYLQLVPQDDDQRRFLDTVKEKELETSQAEPQSKSAIPTATRFKNLSFQDLFSRADRYFKEGDPIAAEYFTLMALKLQPNNPALLRLLANAQDRIRQIDLTEEQKARRTLYVAKQEGYDYLQKGDPISAYFHFLALSKQHRLDDEIARYLQASYEQVIKLAFFLDEIKLLPDYPLAKDVFIKNPVLEKSTQNKTNDFLYIGKIIASQKYQYYALDIEGIGIDASGKVLYHFQADYGKFIEGNLLMHCLNKEDPVKSLKPTYLKGDPPLGPNILIPVKIPPEQLIGLSQSLHSPKELPFAQALSMLEWYPVAQLEPIALLKSILVRIQEPFICLNFCLLTLILGRVFRNRRITRLPLLSFGVIPLLPFILDLPLSLYRYETSILTSILIDKSSLGLIATGATLLGVQVAVLFVILLLGVKGLTREGT
ncbi:MAG: hypothetical protein SNJ78_07390 [Spirochaetales bacterium]